MAGKHRRSDDAQKPRTPRVTETSDYVAMMKRIILGYGQRVGADPVALVHLRELQQAFVDATNLGMFYANRGDSHYSQNEQAAILGVSRQAIAKRIGLGEEVHVRLEAIRDSGALVRIADVRAERARELAAAGVEDRTGSVRELRATGS
jgi:hypothetical protein